MAVKENTEPVSDEIVWDVDTEVQLFYAMNGHKPVGVNKYFQMACIIEKFSSAVNKNITSKVIWDHLDTMYDLQALDDSEILPFPNDEKEFCLPSAEFGEMMTMKQTTESKKEVKDVKEQKEIAKETKENKDKAKENKPESKKEIKEPKKDMKDVKKEIKEVKRELKDPKREFKDARRDIKEARDRFKDVSKEVKKDVKDVIKNKIKVKDKKEDKEEVSKEEPSVPRKERGRLNDSESSSRSSPSTVAESTPKRGVMTPTPKRSSRGGSLLGRRIAPGEQNSSSKPSSPTMLSPSHPSSGSPGHSSPAVPGSNSGANSSSRASSPYPVGASSGSPLVSSSSAASQSSSASTHASGREGTPASGPPAPKRRRT
ncbi:hypothetical protein J437_LFUL004653 [Ladona fulva]|uniref:MRG-binding protein n=1 Tax=Ladona fulva TaxID=123851 RepID=A0A8K0K430_LADFU|nr:hypothetical protein J437_LFUL004653 [Ladona fulva]